MCLPIYYANLKLIQWEHHSCSFITDLLTIPFSFSPACDLALQWGQHYRDSQDQVQPVDFWLSVALQLTEIGMVAEMPEQWGA